MKTRALLVLAVIFFASFIGRLAVMASDINALASNEDEAKAAALPASQCVSAELAETIKERISALDAREKKIANRNVELKAYEQQIEKRLAELETANEKLKATLDSREAARDADISKLAAIYEGMKPQQAGDIINEMNPEFAAGLPRIDEQRKRSAGCRHYGLQKSVYGQRTYGQPNERPIASLIS